MSENENVVPLEKIQKEQPEIKTIKGRGRPAGSTKKTDVIEDISKDAFIGALEAAKQDRLQDDKAKINKKYVSGFDKSLNAVTEKYENGVFKDKPEIALIISSVALLVDALGKEFFMSIGMELLKLCKLGISKGAECIFHQKSEQKENDSQTDKMT